MLYEARSVHMVQKEVKLISDEKVNFDERRAYMENTKAVGLNRDVMHYNSTTHERLPGCRQSTNRTWTLYSPHPQSSVLWSGGPSF